MSYNKKFTHLTEKDITDAEEIRDAVKGLDPFAQRLILERIKGMQDMQTILNRKTA
jgi:hypothetical protein